MPRSVRSLVEAVIEQNSPKALLVIAGLLDQGHDVRFGIVPTWWNTCAICWSRRRARAELGGWSKPPKTICHSWLAMPRDSASSSCKSYCVWTSAEDSLRVSAHPRFVLRPQPRATRLLQPADASSRSVRTNSPQERSAQDHEHLLVHRLRLQLGDRCPRPATPEAAIANQNPRPQCLPSAASPKTAPAARARPATPSSVPAPASARRFRSGQAAPELLCRNRGTWFLSSTAASAAVEVVGRNFKAVSLSIPTSRRFLRWDEVKIEVEFAHWGLGKQATVAGDVGEGDNLKALAALGERLAEVPYACDRSGAGRSRLHDEAIMSGERTGTAGAVDTTNRNIPVKQALEMFGGERLAEVRNDPFPAGGTGMKESHSNMSNILASPGHAGAR